MYNSIEFSGNYSKTFGIFWQYCSDESALTDAGVIDNFPGNSNLLKFKQKIIGQTGKDSKNNVAIMVPLKYLNNLWRTSEIPLKNREINPILILLVDYFVL